ncbi:two-component system OmpR family sensor kinase [Lysinibacter cavernae]|uniref:histidine kinase n=1 Tax=Lysinibacter cavernae TaxID=1640652 RepID=A0A7X5R1H0_9MICO|nr:two-component system OmpR family sensor kinase [Lysinibacter cavernae]
MTVLILTFGILIVGTGTMMILQPQLIAQVDSNLRQLQTDPTPALALGATAQLITRNDVLYAPRDPYYIAVLDADGVLLYDNFQGSKSNAKPEVPLISSADAINVYGNQILHLMQPGNEVSWRAVLVPIVPKDNSGSSGTLLIAQSMSNIDNIMVRYITIFSGFGIVVVLLGAILTRLLVTSTFEPLREVEATAAAIAEGDFSQRVPVTASNTEVGRLSRSLNTMLRRIDSAFADRAKTIEQMRRFVGDASHELRTPLVTVRGYAELYRMGALQTPADVAQAMERIEKEALRMGTLVEDLLALARLDEAKPIEMLPVDLVPLAKDAALDTMASSPSREVRVLVHDATPRLADGSIATTGEHEPVTPLPPAAAPPGVEPSTVTGGISFATGTLARLRQRRIRRSSMLDTQPLTRIERDSEFPNTAITPEESQEIEANVPPAIVLGDENKIRQVMTNLIGNALRFTDDDSPIEIVVSVDEAAETATFEIVDHGEGIPEQIREKIFQRFWRADTSRTRETGGSGLGLAIVSSIVQAHKGTVSAHETPGGGATFRVTLPLLPV